MIASALKKLLDKHVRFRRRVSVEEQRAQKHNQFSQGRQIAYMIYEHFRATGAYEAAQGLYQICSIYVCRTMTSRNLMYDVTKLYYQQVKHHQKWSWKDCTSQNCRILFSVRLYWLCMIKNYSKRWETE